MSAEALLPREPQDAKDPSAEFEVLLQQAMAVRAAAQSGQISDVVRREAAENMLKKLMELFGEDEGEEEEGEKE